MRSLKWSVALGLLAGPILLTGCDGPDGTLLYVFSTHHATMVDGIIPDRGADEMPRVFDTDMGWTVTLVNSYITITDVTIVDCNGGATPLEMFWGPCPEDLRHSDLDPLSVAGQHMPSGDYCELVVDYGPYHTPVVSEDITTQHILPAEADVTGATVFLQGAARVGPEDPMLPFEFRMKEPLSVRLDLSQVDDGGPFHIAEKEDFPKELTVSKTYDRFFDGVHFDALDETAVEARIGPILHQTTRVQEGTSVVPDSPAD